MRADLIRTYKTVHTWTGIVTGMFLFVAFYAGAISVFEPVLTRWGAAPAATAALTPIQQADALIAKLQAERPDIAKHFTLHLGDGPEVPARVTLGDGRDEASVTGADLTAAGELTVATSHRAALGQFVDDLHRTAGLPVDVELGAMAMGVVSAVYVGALVSGLIIILPSFVRDLLALRLGDNLKRLWMDAHNLAGVVSLPFHLVIALTAVAFGLHDELYGMLDLAVYDGGVAKVFQAESPFAKIPRDLSPAPLLPAADLLARLAGVTPDFQPFAMEYRNVGTAAASVMIWGYDEYFLMRTRGFAVLSAVSGAVVNADYLPGSQSPYGATISAFFALHFASFGGLSVKWSYFVLGLAGAFLFYSGNLLWIESRRRREKRNGGPVTQSRAVRWMAAATVGVCLGCVVGLSATLAIGRWLPGAVADPVAWWWGIYYAAFLACVAWAFWRGAARAGAELLYAAAVATAAIPLGALGPWAAQTGNLGAASLADEAAVAATAFAMAAGMVMLAKAAARRADNGPHDSVWSRPVSAAATRELTPAE